MQLALHTGSQPARRTQGWPRAVVHRAGRGAVRRARALAAALLVAGLAPAAAGCGFGEGSTRRAAARPCASRATSATESSARTQLDSVREGETVMRMLRSEFDVTTRFGGRFVQSIDGLEGAGRRRAGGLVLLRERRRGRQGRRRVGRARPATAIQWDHRDWSAAMRVPGDRGRLPGAVRQRTRGQAAPGARGVRGREAQPRARDARDRLERRGRADLGLVARRARHRGGDAARGGALAAGARSCAAPPTLEDGPETSGVFARFTRRRRRRSSCSTSTAQHRAARAARRRRGARARAAAARRRARLDRDRARRRRASRRACARSTQRKLRDAFAVAATGDRVEKLPLVGR